MWQLGINGMRVHLNERTAGFEYLLSNSSSEFAEQPHGKFMLWGGSCYAARSKLIDMIQVSYAFKLLQVLKTDCSINRYMMM